jgi:hypothetical protein
LKKLVKDLAERGLTARAAIWTYTKKDGAKTRSVLYFDPGGVTVQFVEIPD